ncbi:hypothetical protein M0P25_04720 [archaeon]|nr:hypothetical protein [archaeon]MDD3940514.1 hypothetical protein [Candidatus Paceibacterota bacterium]
MNKAKAESVDITFHSRNFNSTISFKRAMEKAKRNNSEIVRIYGKPELVIDPETSIVYLRLRFSKEIEEKLKNKELIIDKNLPYTIDEDTKNKMLKDKKKALKNSTRVWRK